MKFIKTSLGNLGAELTGYIQEPSKEMPDMAVRPAVLVIPGGAYLFCSDRKGYMPAWRMVF